MIKPLMVGLVSVLMLGCSTMPEALLTQSENPVSDYQQLVEEAKQQQEVRVGGVIAQVNNQAEQTRIEIVALPLSSDGRPILGAKSQGRFVAYVDGFLEPLEYHPTRPITVVGLSDGIEAGVIEDYEYQFPVVQVDNFQLWQITQEVLMDDHDPFFSCVGLRCSSLHWRMGISRGQVVERVTE